VGHDSSTIAMADGDCKRRLQEVPRRQEAALQPPWPTAVACGQPPWVMAVGFCKLSRENTHICNGMYGASTTLMKHLAY
jgi:hypothetical protein